ncbi:MAG: TetR/AcrR family transcriptional regulator [Pseudomonadota bacterium]
MSARPRPSNGPGIDWQKRRRAVAEKALPLFLNRPWPNVTISDIAAEADMSFWQIYYSFDGQEDVYRAAVTRLIDEVAEIISAPPEADGAVLETIHRFIEYAAHALQTQSYRELLYLRIRDEPTEPWLGIQYRRKVATPLLENLKSALSQSGRRQGLEIAVDDRCCLETFASLEASLAFPALLQDHGLDEGASRQAIRTSASKIWAGTYNSAEPLRASA